MSNVDVFNFDNLRRGDTRNFTVRSGANIKRATIFYEGISVERFASRTSDETGPPVDNRQIGSQANNITEFTPGIRPSDVLPNGYTVDDLQRIEARHMSIRYYYSDGSLFGEAPETRLLPLSDANAPIATRVEGLRHTSQIRIFMTPGNEVRVWGDAYHFNCYAQTRVTVYYNDRLRNPRITLNGSTLGAFTGWVNDGQSISREILINSLSTGSNPFTFNPNTSGRANVRIEIEYHDEIRDPSNLQPTNGQSVDYASRVSLSWNHNYDLPQTSFDLRWRYVGDSEWTIISENTSTTNYQFTAQYFDVGEVEWQVRTRSTAGVESGWSNLAHFITEALPNTPVFLTDNSYPIANPVIQWESNDQRSFELILFDSNGEELWRKREESPIREQAIEFDLVNDHTYELHLSVRNSEGVWSGYAVTTFYIDYTEPLNTRIIVTPNSSEGHVYIEVYSPEPEGTQPHVIRNEVFRRNVGNRWVKILEDLPANFDYRDYALASGRVYEYRIRSHADNGTFTDTHHTPEPLYLRGIHLHDPDDPSTMVHFRTFEPGRSSERTHHGELTFYEGRTHGVMNFTGNSEGMLNVTIQERSVDKKNKFLDLVDRHKSLLYRDKRGRKMYCVITNTVENDVFWGIEFPLQLIEVYYDEGV